MVGVGDLKEQADRCGVGAVRVGGGGARTIINRIRQFLLSGLFRSCIGGREGVVAYQIVAERRSMKPDRLGILFFGWRALSFWAVLFRNNKTPNPSGSSSAHHQNRFRAASGLNISR